MTKEKINKLIVESNLLITTVTNGYQVWMPENIEKFAELVAKAEREACAKVCDAECNPTPNEGHITTYQSGGYIMAEYLASAIRARGDDGT